MDLIMHKIKVKIRKISFFKWKEVNKSIPIHITNRIN